ncbi:MAG: hypothetical protein WCC17_00175 [Candidatus Nitrosopolaris sp.]
MITGYGRLIHKQIQKMASEKYGLETIFGFTDSIFMKNASIETINELILECKNKYHVTLEHKNRFINTIIFDKKNRFVAWTGNPVDKPILKNLDGVSRSYPKWIRQNIAKIATHIITSEVSDFFSHKCTLISNSIGVSNTLQKKQRSTNIPSKEGGVMLPDRI